MILSKTEAKERGILHSEICGFHTAYPDQSYSESYCPDCKLIREPCGCDEDMGCQICEPEMDKVTKKGGKLDV